MQISLVNDSVIGETLGKDIYSKDGSCLLGKGVVITKTLLLKLKRHNIPYVYIDNFISEGINPEGIISDQLMIKSVMSLRNVLDTLLKQDKKSAQKMIPIREFHAVENIILEIIYSIERSENITYTVIELMETDMYTYKHSINVAILSILTAKSMKYNHETVKAIALGALLHDIGKIKIRNELLTKQGDFSREEIKELQTHAEKGYELVKSEIGMSAYTKQIIRFHHEKLDGSGYPLGLFREQIPDYVRIVTICDIFDNLTTDRPYRKRTSIYNALEILMAESVYKVDPEIYKVFVNHICIYPPGTGVILSDGRKALIVKYRSYNPSRPLVRIINPLHDYSSNSSFEEIDLEKNLTLFIESSIE